MKQRLVELLVCPQCGDDLVLSPGFTAQAAPPPGLPAGVPACERRCARFNLPLPLPPDREALDCSACYGEEINSGQFTCGRGHAYPIEDGVPILLPAPLASDHARTADAFGYEWLRHRVNLASEEREVFLSETMSEPADFAGRLVLDAGCGMGRFTRVAASLGAEVVGVDLSPAVRAAHATYADFPRLHVVRGDLLNPPLHPRSFDLAYSLGVLHHTPDTSQALAAVTGLVKAGGTVAFWLYGRAGRYEDFRTNPLEPARAAFFAARPWLLRPYWLGLKTREVISDALRIFTTRMPVSLLYQLCLLLVPLGAVPLIKYFTFSVHPDWRVRRQENFDWLSPPYQWKHTKEEAREWMKELSVREEKMLDHGLVPKIGFKARR